jgi:hypothetical protein
LHEPRPGCRSSPYPPLTQICNGPGACSLDCEDRRGWGLLVQAGCSSCRPVHNVSVLSYEVSIASALCQGECRRHISSAPWCGYERPLCVVIRVTSARCSLITPSAHFFEPRQVFRPLVPARNMTLSQPRVTPLFYQSQKLAEGDYNLGFGGDEML